MGFTKFATSLFRTKSQDALTSGIKLAASIDPEGVTKANRDMLERDLKQARLNMSKLTKAWEKDIAETAKEKRKMDRAAQAMKKLKADYEDTKDENPEQAQKIMAQAKDVNAEYEKFKAEYQRELKEDEQAKTLLDQAQQVVDAYKAKLGEIDAISRKHKDRKTMAEMKQKQLELQKKNQDALDGLNSMTIGLDALAEVADKEEEELLALEMELNDQEEAVGTSATDSVFADIEAAEAKDEDPFANF